MITVRFIYNGDSLAVVKHVNSGRILIVRNPDRCLDVAGITTKIHENLIVETVSWNERLQDTIRRVKRGQK